MTALGQISAEKCGAGYMAHGAHGDGIQVAEQEPDAKESQQAKDHQHPEWQTPAA